MRCGLYCEYVFVNVLFVRVIVRVEVFGFNGL